MFDPQVDEDSPPPPAAARSHANPAYAASGDFDGSGNNANGDRAGAVEERGDEHNYSIASRSPPVELCAKIVIASTAALACLLLGTIVLSAQSRAPWAVVLLTSAAVFSLMYLVFRLQRASDKICPKESATGTSKTVHRYLAYRGCMIFLLLASAVCAALVIWQPDLWFELKQENTGDTRSSADVPHWELEPELPASINSVQSKAAHNQSTHPVAFVLLLQNETDAPLSRVASQTKMCDMLDSPATELSIIHAFQTVALAKLTQAGESRIWSSAAELQTHQKTSTTRIEVWGRADTTVHSATFTYNTAYDSSGTCLAASGKPCTDATSLHVRKIATAPQASRRLTVTVGRPGDDSSTHLVVQGHNGSMQEVCSSSRYGGRVILDLIGHFQRLDFCSVGTASAGASVGNAKELTLTQRCVDNNTKAEIDFSSPNIYNNASMTLVAESFLDIDARAPEQWAMEIYDFEQGMAEHRALGNCVRVNPGVLLSLAGGPDGAPASIRTVDDKFDPANSKENATKVREQLVAVRSKLQDYIDASATTKNTSRARRQGASDGATQKDSSVRRADLIVQIPIEKVLRLIKGSAKLMAAENLMYPRRSVLQTGNPEIVFDYGFSQAPHVEVAFVNPGNFTFDLRGAMKAYYELTQEFWFITDHITAALKFSLSIAGNIGFEIVGGVPQITSVDLDIPELWDLDFDMSIGFMFKYLPIILGAILTLVLGPLMAWAGGLLASAGGFLLGAALPAGAAVTAGVSGFLGGGLMTAAIGGIAGLVATAVIGLTGVVVFLAGQTLLFAANHIVPAIDKILSKMPGLLDMVEYFLELPFKNPFAKYLLKHLVNLFLVSQLSSAESLVATRMNQGISEVFSIAQNQIPLTPNVELIWGLSSGRNLAPYSDGSFLEVPVFVMPRSTFDNTSRAPKRDLIGWMDKNNKGLATFGDETETFAFYVTDDIVNGIMSSFWHGTAAAKFGSTTGCTRGCSLAATGSTTLIMTKPPEVTFDADPTFAMGWRLKSSGKMLDLNMSTSIGGVTIRDGLVGLELSHLSFSASLGKQTFGFHVDFKALVDDAGQALAGEDLTQALLATDDLSTGLSLVIDSFVVPTLKKLKSGCAFPPIPISRAIWFGLDGITFATGDGVLAVRPEFPETFWGFSACSTYLVDRDAGRKRLVCPKGTALQGLLHYTSTEQSDDAKCCSVDHNLVFSEMMTAQGAPCNSDRDLFVDRPKAKVRDDVCATVVVGSRPFLRSRDVNHMMASQCPDDMVVVSFNKPSKTEFMFKCCKLENAYVQYVGCPFGDASVVGGTAMPFGRWDSECTPGTAMIAIGAAGADVRFTRCCPVHRALDGCPTTTASVCSGKGICVDQHDTRLGTSAKSCVCEDKYSGKACNLKCPLSADGATCSNRGVCQDGGCNCDEGYYGSACQHAMCNPHCMHGTCTYPGHCECSEGWSGPLCNQPARCEDNNFACYLYQVGNGMCDLECYKSGCGDPDCGVGQDCPCDDYQPWKAQGNECHPACMVPACAETSTCTDPCPSMCPLTERGDGVCDADCASAECMNDDGDCDMASTEPTGSFFHENLDTILSVFSFRLYDDDVVDMDIKCTRKSRWGVRETFNLVPFRAEGDVVPALLKVEGLAAIYMHEHNRDMVVTFRGTHDLPMWALNVIGAMPARCTLTSQDCGAVHSGWQSLLLSGYVKMFAAIEDLWRTNKKLRRIAITGHSLGGALAQMFAMKLSHDAPLLRHLLLVRTYGSPKFCKTGTGCKEAYNALITNSVAFRASCQGMVDPVPRVPMNYEPTTVSTIVAVPKGVEDVACHLGYPAAMMVRHSACSVFKIQAPTSDKSSASTPGDEAVVGSPTTQAPTEVYDEVVDQSHSELCRAQCSIGMYPYLCDASRSAKCLPCLNSVPNARHSSNGQLDGICDVECKEGFHTRRLMTGKQVCEPCVDYCVDGEFLSDCGPSKPGECSPCTNMPDSAVVLGAGGGSNNCPWRCKLGYHAVLGNLPACLPCGMCPVGQWRDGCGGTAETTAGQLNDYTKKFSSPGVCKPCVHSMANAEFTTSGLSASSSCGEDCSHGFYRKGPECLRCDVGCDIGFFRAGCSGEQPGSCIRCTNTPSHAVATSHGATDGLCPWKCIDGWSRGIDGKCRPCVECGTGMSRSGCGQSVGTCKNCSTKPANAHFVRAADKNDNCKWKCSKGLYQSDKFKCDACIVCPAGERTTSCEDGRMGTCVNCVSDLPHNAYATACDDEPEHWSCVAGFHALDGACLKCGACLVGQFRTGCEGSDKGVCAPCSNKPAHASYTGEGGLLNSCSWVCDRGYWKDGGLCRKCADGCKPGKFLNGCGDASSGTCEECSNIPSHAAAITNGRQQDACEWQCSGEYYRRGTECGRCPDCLIGSYRADCSGGSKGSCAECTQKPADSHFVSPGRITQNDCKWECDHGFVNVSNVCRQCKDDCPIGQYLEGCGHRASGQCVGCSNIPSVAKATSNGNQIGLCSWTCDSGFYKNGTGCVTCPLCGVGTYRSSCELDGPGHCARCSGNPKHSHFVSHGALKDSCSWECDHDYVYDVDSDACRACRDDCDPGFYLYGCSHASVGQCQRCSMNVYEASFTSNGNGSDACALECNTGRHLEGNACVRCPSCGIAQYRSGCSTTGSGDCTACTNNPTHSTFVSDGGFANICEWKCEEAYFKNSGVCEQCVDRCSIGKYLASCGGSTAGICTQCATPVHAVATSNGNTADACNWECVDGFHASDGACLKCGACLVGQFRTGCEGSDKGVCAPCSNKPAHASYTGEGGLLNSCSWVCDRGYWKDGGLCRKCADGCKPGKFLNGCGDASSGTCEECSNIPSHAAAITNGRQQDACEWQCSGEYYRRGTECGRCPDCLIGSYRADCSGGSKGSCAECTQKPANSHFVSPGRITQNDCKWACDDGLFKTEDGVCEPCSTGSVCAHCLKPCPPGEHRAGCNPNKPGICTDCAKIPNNAAFQVDATGVHSCAWQCTERFYASSDLSSCIECDSQCGVGQFREGCGVQSAGECRICTLKPTGSTFTSGGGLTDTCEWACNAGSFEDGGNGKCTKCVADCSIGQYKRGCRTQSAGSCTPCTGKPLNSEYTTDGKFENQCTWTCNPGWHQSGTQCVRCDTSCGVGRYRSGCRGTFEGTCSACTKKPHANAFYTAGGALQDSCEWACEPSFWRSGSSCTGCAQDCNTGDYRVGCSSTSSGKCTQCTNKPSNSRYTTAGGLTNTCGWGCVDTHFKDADSKCQSCLATSCLVGQYTKGCGGDSKGSCNVCTNKPQHSSYVSHGGIANACEWKCDSTFWKTSDKTCARCAETCPTGQYRGGCSQSSAGTCVSCTAKPANAVYTKHGGLSDSCTWVCNKDHFLSGGKCEQCDRGCAVGQYRNDCAGSSTGSCSACTNKPTNAVYDTNGGTANSCGWKCVDGFHRQGSICVACSETCGVGKYRSGCAHNEPGACRVCTIKPTSFSHFTSSGGLVNACAWQCTERFYASSDLSSCIECDSQCGVGQFREGCGVQSAGECRICTLKPTGSTFTSGGGLTDTCEWACNAGSFEDGGNGKCTKCVADCSIGQYKRGCRTQSAGSCTPCTGKPLNSEYTTDGKFENQCTWTCNPGWHQSGTQCVRCDTSCGVGRYRSGCRGTFEGTCSACTKKPHANAFYTAGGALQDSCEWACEPSFWRSGSSCTGCAQDCNTGDYRVGCSSTSSGKCTQCTNKPSNSRYTTAGGLTNTCGWGCVDTHFKDADSKCQSCLATSCLVGQYTKGCGGDSKGSCNVCTNKPQHSSYVSHGGIANACEWKCDSTFWKTSDKTCARCAETCPTGQYRGGCSQSSAGTCVSCTAKPANAVYTKHGGLSDSCTWVCNKDHFLSGGKCEQCDRGCAVGQYRNDCAGSSTGSCSACTNKPTNAVYDTNGGTANSCGWKCVDGFHRQGSICVACSETCGVGKYRSGCAHNEPGACTACSNAPANALFVSHGGLTNECRWQCKDSFFKSSRSCSACSRTSPVGEYLKGCASSNAGVHTPCTKAPENARYTTSGLFTDSCKWACSANFHLDSGFCKPCRTCLTGQYLNGCSSDDRGTCTPCTNNPSRQDTLFGRLAAISPKA